MTIVIDSVKISDNLFIGFHRDITYLKEIEEKVRESNKKLEHFAHNVAHDIKSPMGVIISGLQILKDNKNEEDRTNITNIIYKKGYELTHLIDAILELSKINVKNINFKNINIKKIIESVLQNLNNIIIKKDAEIIYNNIDINIMGDNNFFISLFQNLINNALKYNENKPKIIISTELLNKNEYLFSIKDNGIGIEETNNKEEFFELFFRVNSIKNKYEGNGLGLPACKKIVELHNGNIWFESKLGEGTTFYFTIPIKQKNI